MTMHIRHDLNTVYACGSFHTAMIKPFEIPVLVGYSRICIYMIYRLYRESVNSIHDDISDGQPRKAGFMQVWVAVIHE